MKKIFALLLALVMVFALCACGAKEAPAAAPAEKPAAAPAEKPAEAPAEAPADAAPAYPETNIVFSVFCAESTPSGLGVQYFKDIVEERSGGAVTVETYFNGVLYNQDTEFEATMKGDVDMIVTSLNYAMNYITELKTTFCPYMWVSIDHVRDFWFKNEVGVSYLDREAEELGVRQLSWHEGGYRNVCLNLDKKVDSTEALAGVKLRSSPAENMIAMTAALGGNPISMAFSDCYLGIQTGVADGLEVDLTGLIANGLAEVTKSVTLTQHYLSLDGFAVSWKNFQSWDPAVQELVKECAAEAADYITEISKETEVDAVAQLNELGVKIYELTDEERAAYREQVLDAFIGSDYCKDYDMDLFNAIREMGKNY